METVIGLLRSIVAGLLIGNVYALISLGISIIWGLMGVVNFAQGDILMVSMYAIFIGFTVTGFEPLLLMPLSLVTGCILCVLVYLLIAKRISNISREMQILATFGFGMFLRASIQYVFSPDYQMVPSKFLSGAIKIGNVLSLSKPLVFAGLISLSTTIIIYWYLRSTDVGRAILATSEDKNTAKLMGINSNKMFIIGWGLGGACAGIAGAVLVNYYYIYPNVGTQLGLIGYIAVALGGLGNLAGTVIAAMLLGLVEVVAGAYISSALKMVFAYAMYLIILTVRPKGLLGRW